MRRSLKLSAVVLVLACAAAAQVALRSKSPATAPALSQGVFAALGGLRSIAAEVVWFRADRLQEEGRYVELAQLASTLTLMEPHTPEVWSYAAWNLAYNVSVMMNSPEDRWRWVDAGIKLLRDEGLRLNPRSPELYREVAWMFELKMGTDIDSAADFYRRKWKETVQEVRLEGTWEEKLGMDPTAMAEVERETGFDDWTDVRLSAIYFASRGLKFAAGRERALLEEIIRQSAIIYRKHH